MNCEDHRSSRGYWTPKNQAPLAGLSQLSWWACWFCWLSSPCFHMTARKRTLVTTEGWANIHQRLAGPSKTSSAFHSWHISTFCSPLPVVWLNTGLYWTPEVKHFHGGLMHSFLFLSLFLHRRCTLFIYFLPPFWSSLWIFSPVDTSY